MEISPDGVKALNTLINIALLTGGIVSLVTSIILWKLMLAAANYLDAKTTEIKFKR